MKGILLLLYKHNIISKTLGFTRLIEKMYILTKKAQKDKITYLQKKKIYNLCL